MRTSLLIATMLVAVPLATAAPASAQLQDFQCREDDPWCQPLITLYEFAEETLASTIDDATDLVAYVMNAVENFEPPCEVTPDGHIVCQ